MALISRKLWFVDLDGQHRLDQGELLARPEPVVVLGEPGMGKTELLKVFGEMDGNIYCRAGKLVNQPKPETILGNATRLVIDALDEVPAQRDGDAVDLVLQKLGLLNYPPFIISCRVGEWRAAIAAKAIEEQYDRRPLEVHLEPLNRDEQQGLLTQLTGDKGRATALLDHFDRFGLDFLGNPQTLELIAALPADQNLPETSGALFEAAIETLRREQNPVKDELPREAALAAAGAAFAGLILSGNARIVDKPSGQIDPDDMALPLCEVEEFDQHHVRRASNTKLFTTDQDGLTYAHRRVGEFAGASWLAARADTRRKRQRLLEQFKSHGLVPASLRGLHAWLSRDSRLADAVIDADPMGVVEYGDAEALTAEQARRLFNALERLAHDNPLFSGWQTYRAASLVSSVLMPEVERVVSDRGAEFRLRMLLLQQLKDAPTAVELRLPLRDCMLNEHEAYAIRHACALVLIAVGGEDWPKQLERLGSHVSRDAARLSYEVFDDIGVDVFNDRQIVEIVLAYDELSVCPVPFEPRESMIRGFYRLPDSVPVGRLDRLLDTFTDYLEALLPQHAGLEENQLIDLIYALILKRLQKGGAIGPLQLWRWLQPLGRPTSYHRHRGKTVAGWLETHDAVRRAIQRHVILDAPGDGDVRHRASKLHRRVSGLIPSRADVVALLRALDPTNRTDERWREVMSLAQCWGEDGRAVREAAKPFASHRADLLAWIDGLAVPEVTEWERKQQQRARQRKAKQAVKFAKHRRDFLRSIEKVRAGEYGYVIGPAQAYLKRFDDIGDGLAPHERVAEWLGDDVAAAAHQGFQAFLRIRPPRPSAGMISRGYAASKRWPAGDIIVSALAERVRTRRRPFRGIRSERLAAGLFESWHTAIGDHVGLKKLAPKLEAELRRRGKWEQVLRLYIEPQLRQRSQHIDHLWAVMGEDGDGPAADLAAEWLTEFPDMSIEAEVEMIDRLLRSNRREPLHALLADRDARDLSEERQRSWEAVALIIDFDKARVRLAGKIDRNLLWHLRNRIGDRRRDEHEGVFLSVGQLAWIIDNFRAPWPNTDRPGTVTSGDINPWDASEYIRSLIARLGNDVSREAVEALALLRDAPADGYTTALRIVAAEQRQKQADESYVPPTLAEITAVLNGAPPTNTADLSAIVTDDLRELGRRLRGSSEDEIALFWRDDGQPRTENECRDRVVALSRGHLQHLAIYPATEADMPQSKRADIVFQHGALLLPVEAKRQQNAGLWTAITEQLQALYVGHWQAEGQGIFLVFWFGPEFTIPVRQDGEPKPTTSAELQELLEAHKAVRDGHVKVVVLDLSR